MSKKFTVDARAIITLGRDSIKDHRTALVELVKNSYDADATEVEVQIMAKTDPPFIRIADNGCGMTESDIDKHWLRIGYSEKKIEKMSQKRNRRKTGEKGIGRISADRLGAILELITKHEKGNTFGLKINWDDFDVPNNDINDIEIHVLNNPKIFIPYKHKHDLIHTGTELIIKELRQEWTVEDIKKISRELSSLVSPFRKIDDFHVQIKTDLIEGYEEQLESDWNENFEIRLDIDYDGKGEIISYTITDRDPNSFGRKREIKDIIKWQNFISQQSGTDYQANLKLGSISATILFYPQITRLLEGTGLRVSDLREFLSNNAGIRIYRDNIRVKPYGDPDEAEGDWLGLGRKVARNPAGPSRPSYTIPPNSLVGAVFVSRDGNPDLVDSSSREGLIEGDAFLNLREFVSGCVNIIEAHYHTKFREEKQIANEINYSPSDEIRSLNQELQVLKSDLSKIRQYIPVANEQNVDSLLSKVEDVVEHIEEARKSILELESQATIYRGLATIGISASVFGHETQTSIAGLVGATYNISRLLQKNPPNIEESLESIEEAKFYADQVSAWGIFALDRIRRDKRRKTKQDIGKLVLGVIEVLKSAMKVVSIDVQHNHITSIEMRTFAMDIEALVLNLLTNAYTACIQKRINRVIRVQLNEKTQNNIKGCELIVSDSGYGVDKKFMEAIWNPLFSTKIDEKGKKIGTGLGLSIVQSIVDDLNGTRKVDTDPELKGARFTIWFPVKGV